MTRNHEFWAVKASRGVRTKIAAIIWVGLLAPAVAVQSAAQVERPVRTFPQFAGSWVLDEGASAGRLTITPRVPLSMTIEITPIEITVTKRPRLGPRDRASATPPPEIYRLDGTETSPVDAATGVPLQRSYRFTLVADMLALTIKETRDDAFTLVTDAYSVAGDVLTLDRQLSSVTAEGQILVMQEPTNNFRHTYVYRRAAAPPAN